MNSALELPPVWRIFAAFLIAPMFASLLVASQTPNGLPNWSGVFQAASLIALFYAYPATVLFGVPAFLILRHRARLWLVTCLATGAAVAAIPMLLLALISHPQHAFSNGHVTHQNGVRTLDGWIDLGRLVGVIAILGALAGFVFWIVAAAGVRRLRVNAVATDANSKSPTP